MKEEQIVKIREVLQKDEVKEVVNYLATKNGVKYNLTKTAEELIELAEVCLKMANKKPDLAPPKSALIEELGDVLFRTEVLVKSLDINIEDINERVYYKAKKYLDWVKNERFSEI